MIEAEEIIESKLIGVLAAALPGVSVEGILTPALEGELKTSDDTFVNVAVDQSEQRLDSRGPCVPFGFTAKVALHFSFADDKSGYDFRNACRSVRGALTNLQGDGCSSLNDATNGFYCDCFTLESTSTQVDIDDDGGANVKVYNASIVGRTINNTNNEERAE